MISWSVCVLTGAMPMIVIVGMAMVVRRSDWNCNWSQPRNPGANRTDGQEGRTAQSRQHHQRIHDRANEQEATDRNQILQAGFHHLVDT